MKFTYNDIYLANKYIGAVIANPLYETIRIEVFCQMAEDFFFYSKVRRRDFCKKLLNESITIYQVGLYLNYEKKYSIQSDML